MSGGGRTAARLGTMARMARLAHAAALGLLAAACSPPAAPAPAPALAPAAPGAAAAGTPAEIIAAIAADLAALGTTCPRLAAFDPQTAIGPSGLDLDYTFHTHAPKRRGGWTAAVPNPDPDGIFLHVDLHDPGSTAQIHTQPIVPMRDVAGMKLMMLLLEGEAGPPCAPAIDAVLAKHAPGPPRIGR